MEPELLMSVLLAGMTMLGVAGSLVGAARRGVAHQRGVVGAWEKAGETLGAELHVEGEGTLAARRLRLVSESAVAEGVTVVLEAAVPADPQLEGHTRASAPYVLGAGPRFRLTRQGFLSPFDRAFGGVEVTIGDDAFRTQILLTAPDPAPVKRLFGAPLRAAVMAFPRMPSLWSEGVLVELVWDGVEHRPEVMARARDLVAVVASHGLAGLATLTQLPGARLAGPELRVARGPAELRFVAGFADDQLHYECRGRATTALPELLVEITAEGAVRGELPDGLVDPDVRGLLPDLGPAVWTTAGEDVVIRFAKLPTEAQAEAAIELLTPLTRVHGHGAFR